MSLLDCRKAGLPEGVARPRTSALVMMCFIGVSIAHPAWGQPIAPAGATQSNEHRIADTVKFLAGGALGLAAHEGGHLAFDVAFDARPYVTHIDFGGLPFFAISHHDVTPRREFAIASAGFWVQEATNEWLLSTHPTLRRDHAPVAKGVFAFNVLASLAYAAAALAKAGPVERDTRGMAATVDVDERAIALVVLAPALLDGYRYFRPDARVAIWASRIAKAGSVVLIVKGKK